MKVMPWSILVDLVSDVDAWSKYPRYTSWYNKLWLSERLGYKCGPAGVPVPVKGTYIVRPIYNLLGMGLGAKYMFLSPVYEENQIPAGHFWCEKFEGFHYTIDYEWAHLGEGQWGWKQLHCWRGQNGPQLWRFTKWEKCDYPLELPWFFNKLGWSWDMRYINIESIGDKIIEAHLRPNPDHQEDYDTLIPIWKGDDTKQYIDDGYVFIEDFEDAEGQLPLPRLGFYVK